MLEEDGAPEETAGEQIATQHDIPWIDINTSNDVTGPYTEDQKNNWNQQRELFMVRKINEHRSEGESLLIICGFAHIQPLTDILEQDGTPIQLWNYRNLDWYLPGVFAQD